MSLCINPDCDRAKKQIDQRQELFCSSCGSSLLLNNIYRVLRYLGSGGFGSAYLVDDGKTRKVLKILHNTHPKAVSLFDQEADVLQKLHHSGIPRVDEGGRFDYFPKRSTKPLRCLVMEYIEGDNLADYLAKQDFQPISEPVAIDWLHELVEILDLVHGAKYFHRDIKPSNIMIRNTGKLALIDFGTAREETQTYLQKQKGQNVTGIVSIGYTPHEQANGRAEYRSDFFALGRTFVFLLTGKEPDEFEETVTKGLRWQQKAEGYSQALRDLIDYLMRPEVTDRPSNTQEILQKIAVFAKIQKNTTNILTTANLHKFLSCKKAQQDSLIELVFGKGTIEVGVNRSDFFISEKFEIETGNKEAINGLVEVKSTEFIKAVSELAEANLEIDFSLQDGVLHLSPTHSISVGRIIPNRSRAEKNIVIIKDTEILRWYAEVSLTTIQRGTNPPCPYIDGVLTKAGLHLMVANAVMSTNRFYKLKTLKEWGSTLSVTDTTTARIFLPSSAVMELPSDTPLEIHVGGRTLLLKAGAMTVKIERFKDPLAHYIAASFNVDAMNNRELGITLDEPESSSEPSRMDKLVNWAEQTKAVVCHLLAGPSGIWVGPMNFAKQGFEANPTVLQLRDTPIAQPQIVQLPVRVLVNSIKTLGLKSVRILFPSKELLCTHIFP